MADNRDPEVDSPLAESLRKSGARRSDVQGFEAYQTNQGTVVVASPADLARSGIKAHRRTHAPHDPAYVKMAAALHNNPDYDVDWGQYHPEVVSKLTHIFRWDKDLGRKGEWCQLMVRGTMNSCLLRFADGFTLVTSRNSIKRRTDVLFGGETDGVRKSAGQNPRLDEGPDGFRVGEVVVRTYVAGVQREAPGTCHVDA